MKKDLITLLINNVDEDTFGHALQKTVNKMVKNPKQKLKIENDYIKNPEKRLKIYQQNVHTYIDQIINEINKLFVSSEVGQKKLNLPESKISLNRWKLLANIK